MRLYKIQNGNYLSQGKVLSVINEKEEVIGLVTKEDIPGYEKNHVFSFTAHTDGSKAIVGIKKNGLARLVVTKYGVITENGDYELKEKVGNNIFYFCVTGVLGETSIRIEEDWDGMLEVKADGVVIASVKEKDLHGIFQFEDEIQENDLLFAITVLMFFMKKIYDDDAKLLEWLLLN